MDTPGVVDELTVLLLGLATAAWAAARAATPTLIGREEAWAGCGAHADAAEQRISGCTYRIEAGPDSGGDRVAALVANGVTRHEQGEHDLAVDDFTEAIRLDPRRTQAYHGRALAWAEKGELAHAVADMDEVVRLEPASAEALIVRASLFAEMGDRDRAMVDLTAAIRLDPDNAAPFYLRGVWRGVLAIGQRDFAEVIADLTKVIRLRVAGQPDRFHHLWDPYYLRGVAFLATGSLDRAVADLSEALRHAPDDTEARIRRCVAFWRRGDRTAALADCAVVQHAALEHGFPSLSPWTVLAGLHLLEGNAKAARQALEEALRRSPAEPLALWLRAGLRLRDGDKAGSTADRQAAVAEQANRMEPPDLDAVAQELFGPELGLVLPTSRR